MSTGKTLRENPDYEPESAGPKSYILISVALLIVAGLCLAGFLWWTNRPSEPVDTKVLAENASFIVGDKSAPVTIDVFGDYHCPHCATFEEQSGSAIRQAVLDGEIRVRYHMLNFLDDDSESGDYSSRAAGAALCVARSDDREVFWRLHRELFEKSGDDPDNAAIAALAAKAGATPETQSCITRGALVDEGRSMAEASQQQLKNSTDGQVATPTVLLAGEPVDDIMDGTGWLTGILAGDRPSS
ncbi:DsbA family protein [Gordonia shandongensis]|uniref:DsbA family protein n=1 Tax=Gordonia shandongensis TaxID=376351 RepID=UPI0004015862|nr:thioredoxin domain-containing protein [Gordonia shandongensis]